MHTRTAFHFDVHSMYVFTDYIAYTYPDICIHVQLLIFDVHDMYICTYYIAYTYTDMCTHVHMLTRVRAAASPSHTPSPLAGIDQKYRDPATGLPISGTNSFFFLKSTLYSYINSLYSYIYINSKFLFLSSKYSIHI